MTLDELYASLPKLQCKRKCQECCGPIGMTQLELDRLQQSSGIRLETIEQYPGVHLTTCLTCPLLNPLSGECMAYEQRPLICRLWGLVKKMRCPFGCQPERWLSDAEATALFRNASAISARMNNLSVTLPTLSVDFPRV